MDFKCCVVTSLYVQTYYPGNPNRGAALLASYVWEHEADYWLGMTDEECKMKVGTLHSRASTECSRIFHQEGPC